VKWIIAAALSGVLIAVGTGWFISPGERTTTVVGEVSGGTKAPNPPWLRNGRFAYVRDGVASLLVHCNQAEECRGKVTMFRKGTEAQLGTGYYRIKAGTDTRIRITVPPFKGERQRVTLTWLDRTGWPSESYDEITLRH